MTRVAFPQGMQVQGLELASGLLLWAEIDEVGTRVNWLVVSRHDGDQPINWGTDPILRGVTQEARDAALEARMDLLVAMYDIGAASA